MLTFFRRIRKGLLGDGATSKYLLYAVGEIALVVIGILIALQINNWNEDNKEQKRIELYAISLIQDLEQDIIMIDDIYTQNNEIINRIDSLSRYIQDKQIRDISNMDLFYFTLNKPHRPYLWNRITLDDMKSSGSLQLIKNDSLSVKIAEYDAFTHHLDEDYENDKSQFEKAIQFSSSVVNYNYSNFDELRRSLLPGNNERGYDFFSTAEYKIGIAQNLQLLTKDMNDIYQMGNGFNILKSYLKIRTTDELPRLRNDASSLIMMLKEIQ